MAAEGARSRTTASTLMAAVSNERSYGCAAVGLDDDRPAGQRSRVSYFLPPGGFVGALPLPWLAKGEVGAASFGFSFLGFFASRLPRFSPLAMACLRCWSVSGRVGFSVARRRVEQMIEVGHHAVNQLTPAWIGRSCTLGEEAQQIACFLDCL